MNRFPKQTQNGFTLIEMMVVISIMALISTALVIAYGRQGGVRGLKIGQSEMVTNIRKAQSYTLSGRGFATKAGTIAPKYYALRFEGGTNRYILQGIDVENESIVDLESYSLPSEISIQSVSVMQGSGKPVDVKNVSVVYSSPYGKMYAYSSAIDGCESELVNVVKNPGCLLSTADRAVQITLTDKQGTTKTVTLYGVSGSVDVDNVQIPSGETDKLMELQL